MTRMIYHARMSKPTLRVETEYGTFARQTARDYKFVVGSRGQTADTLREIVENRIAYNNRQIAEYTKVVEAGVVPQYRGNDGKMRDSLVPLAEFSKFIVDLTADNVRREAELATTDFEAESQLGHEWGWSSRRDLAEKEAAKVASLGYQSVRIFEVK